LTNRQSSADTAVRRKAEHCTWPVGTRVNKPENDDAAILDRVEVTTA
jgi:hypothetical protein